MTPILPVAVLWPLLMVAVTATSPSQVTHIKNLFNANGRPIPILSGRNLFGPDRNTNNRNINRFPVIVVNGHVQYPTGAPPAAGQKRASIPVVNSGVNVPADYYENRRLTEVTNIPWGRNPNPPLSNLSPPQSSFTVVDGIKQFSFDLLGRFRKPDSAGKNIVFSPVSITSLLSLFTLATRGDTRAEIDAAIMNVPGNAVTAAKHAQYAQILKSLNHASKGLTVKTSNRLYVATDVDIHRNFTKQAADHYNVSVARVDFVTDLFVKDRINKWVEQETSGLVKEFLVDPPIPDTRLIAINTIYFKGAWKLPFLPAFTMENKFDTGKEVIRHPFMTNMIEVKFFNSKKLNLDIVALPYDGDKFSMYIIVPTESPKDRSIESVEVQLDSPLLQELIDSMVLRNVSVSLPKMALSMKRYLNLPLSELGINKMFSPIGDFGGMTNSQLRVNTFLHEAVMQIDEKGTVAAAVSGAMLDRRGPEYRIKVNKPSIMFIREHATGLPLFWTRLVQPEKIKA